MCYQNRHSYCTMWCSEKQRTQTVSIMAYSFTALSWYTYFFLIYLKTYFLTYWLIDLLIYSIHHTSSWEANRFSASQDIPRNVRNLNVHYRIYKCLPPVPTLSHTNPVHALTSHFLNINLNIILPFMPGSSKWSLSISCPPTKPCIHLSSPTYVLHTLPTSISWIWSSKQYWVSSTDH